jgi:hypothetical protein
MYYKYATGRAIKALKSNDKESLSYVPRVDSEYGSSRASGGNNVMLDDRAMITELYTGLNKLLKGYVSELLDEYEYLDSPIYNEEGLDRETLAQLVSRVRENASNEHDELQEIELEAVDYDMFCRKAMLQSIIESLVINDIFAVRRPRYRLLKQNYIYRDGVYDGVARR